MCNLQDSIADSRLAEVSAEPSLRRRAIIGCRTRMIRLATVMSGQRSLPQALILKPSTSSQKRFRKARSDNRGALTPNYLPTVMNTNVHLRVSHRSCFRKEQRQSKQLPLIMIYVSNQPISEEFAVLIRFPSGP